MWKILRAEVAITATLLMTIAASTSAVQAQETSTIINQNTVGFNLPGVTLPQGHDEVRAADGTTCRSAISGSGAYLDFGVIGNPNENSSRSAMSSYGRIVIPLGRKAKRLDCSRLYDLEVQRLQMELRLMQMGLNRGVTPPSGTATGGFTEETTVTTNSGETMTVTETASESTVERQLAMNETKTTGDWDDDGWTTTGRTEKLKK